MMCKKQMMAGASVVAFFCGATVFVSDVTWQVAGETYDTALEAAYRDTFPSVKQAPEC